MIGAAVAVGVAADQVLGEPPAAVHPVAWFGSAMSRLERRWWRDDRRAGLAFTIVGVGGGALAGTGLSRLVGRPAAVAVASWIAIAGRMLDTEALAVAALLEAGDVPGARHRVMSLVGRDVDQLTAADIVRATIESVAENTTDAVIAPICWAAVAGASGVLAHRAANTLDAMVGHRTPRYQRFGWASARFDDLVNAAPARVSALAVAVVRPTRARAVWRTVRDDAPAHPSPNAGVVEAAFAAALGVRLGGTNRYAGSDEARGTLGHGRAPEVADIGRAVQLRRATTAVLAGAIGLVGLVLSRSRSCHRSSRRRHR